MGTAPAAPAAQRATMSARTVLHPSGFKGLGIIPSALSFSRYRLTKVIAATAIRMVLRISLSSLRGSCPRESRVHAVRSNTP